MTVVGNYLHTCASAVYRLLFKGGVYSKKNTVFNNNITSIIQYFCLIQIIKVGLYVPVTVGEVFLQYVLKLMLGYYAL